MSSLSAGVPTSIMCVTRIFCSGCANWPLGKSAWALYAPEAIYWLKPELLNGYRCTIHWENLASLREEYPRLIVSSELFEIDRDRYTCSGGTAPLDMMLHLISRQQNPALAAAISEEFVCERIRGRHDRQRIPLRLRLGTSQPKLIEAVALMEANLEETYESR